MCRFVPTQWFCHHEDRNHVEHCFYVRDKINLGFPAGTYTPCTVAQVPDDEPWFYSPWMCGDCHDNWTILRNREWDDIWTNFQTKVQGSSEEIKGRVTLLQGRYQNTLNDDLERWNDNTAAGMDESVYIMYPQRIIDAETSVTALIDHWMAQNTPANTSQSHGRHGGGHGGSGANGKSSRSHGSSSQHKSSGSHGRHRA
jgi:hypothetical protein